MKEIYNLENAKQIMTNYISFIIYTVEDFTPLKNSNGLPFEFSTKLPLRFDSDTLLACPTSNLRWYKPTFHNL